MPQIAVESKYFDAEQLRNVGVNLLQNAGLTPADAWLVADSLVESNLRGIDSHGIARLPHYLNRIRHGSINPRPDIKVELLAPASARLNADHALGQVAMAQATDVAIDLARQSGAGWVAIQNSSHCGALAYYGLKIADAGMIGLVFTHVDPMVLPFGASQPFCGTNPLCFTAPRASCGASELATGALCLDMATSKTPWNSVANAALEGVEIPLGWAVDAHGRDTRQPEQVHALYPFGEYKGSGLGLMVDVLCAMLSGAPFGPDIPKMYGDPSENRRLGGMVGAIDIGRFVALEQFHSRMCDLLTRWTSLPTVPSAEKVYFPGEPELLERERRLQTGIPLGLQLLQQLNSLAQAANLPCLELERRDDAAHQLPAAPFLSERNSAERSKSKSN